MNKEKERMIKVRSKNVVSSVTKSRNALEETTEENEGNKESRVPEDPRRKDITEFLRKVMQRKDT